MSEEIIKTIMTPNELEPEIKLQGAWFFYQCNGNAYVEHHNTNEKNMLEPGTPLTHKAIFQLQDMMLQCKVGVHERLGFQGSIPKNAIWFDNRHQIQLMWYSEPSKRTLKYLHIHEDDDEIGTAATKKDPIRIETTFPYIVYFVNGDEFFVYVCKEIPTTDTELFMLPAGNVAEDGDVCMGSVRVKKNRNMEQLMINYEIGFWNSYFTDHGDNYGTFTFKWYRMHPEEQLLNLKPMGKTIKKIIKDVTQNT